MPHTIIEDLFYGRIAPWARPVSSEPADQALMREITEAKLYFTKDMSFEEKERFEELEDLYTREAYNQEVEIYTHGLVLGVSLMLEVMEKRDVLFRRDRE